LPNLVISFYNGELVDISDVSAFRNSFLSILGL